MFLCISAVLNAYIGPRCTYTRSESVFADMHERACMRSLACMQFLVLRREQGVLAGFCASFAEEFVAAAVDLNSLHFICSAESICKR